MRYLSKLSPRTIPIKRNKPLRAPFATISNMGDATANQGQTVPAKDAQQPTPETTSANDAKTETSTGNGSAQEQQAQETGPGPKVLRSHFRGMPKQWEKNRRE